MTILVATSMDGPLSAFAADVTTHVKTAAGVRELTLVLQHLAEIESLTSQNLGPDADKDAEKDGASHLSDDSVDKMLHDLYLSAAPELRGTVEFVRGFIAYTLARSNAHLLSWRRTAAVCVRWEILAPLMFHILNSCLTTKIVTPRSTIGRLFKTSGFLTAMELVCRAGTLRKESIIQLASTIAGSLFLMEWALGQRLISGGATDALIDPAILRVCFSYLGTILKLQRRLERLLLSLQTQTDASVIVPTSASASASSSLSGTTATRLKEGMRKVVTLSDIIRHSHVLQGLVSACESTDGSTGRISGMVERLVERSLDAQQGLLLLPSVMVHLSQKELHEISRGRGVEAVHGHKHGHIPSDDKCTNPVCTCLEGFSESAMKTLLCSGCRHVRYCSRTCQREDRDRHHLAGCI